MTRATALTLSLFAAACTTEAPAESRHAPTTPIPYLPVTTADGTSVIARGGTMEVQIPDTVGFAGDASDGFAVEPTGDVWPNLEAPVYWLRAARTGIGSFEIATNRGIATGMVHGAELARIALQPVRYQLDGHSPVAVDVRRPDVQLALFDANDQRLVDASLAVIDEQASVATQNGWDQLALGATVGTHTIDVTADSMAARQIAIEVVDHVDRIEAVRVGDRTCYHAYTGRYEVATELGLAVPEPTADNCTRQSTSTTTGQ